MSDSESVVSNVVCLSEESDLEVVEIPGPETTGEEGDTVSSF